MKPFTLDLSSYSSLGEALRTANNKWANHIALIEADRDRENHRLTYSEFNSMALKLAKSLQSSGFKPGQRGAILMSNQSKWLVSAYAIFSDQKALFAAIRDCRRRGAPGSLDS